MKDLECIHSWWRTDHKAVKYMDLVVRWDKYIFDSKKDIDQTDCIIEQAWSIHEGF